MSQPNLNLLDKGALGIALIRTDTDPFEDEWAIWGGKGFIALTVAAHILLIFRDVLGYNMPSRLLTTAIVVAIAALCYVPVRFATHSESEIQQVRLTRRDRWMYRAWGLFLCPFNLLIWIPIWYFFNIYS